MIYNISSYAYIMYWSLFHGNRISTKQNMNAYYKWFVLLGVNTFETAILANFALSYLMMISQWLPITNTSRRCLTVYPGKHKRLITLRGPPHCCLIHVIAVYIHRPYYQNAVNFDSCDLGFYNLPYTIAGKLLLPTQKLASVMTLDLMYQSGLWIPMTNETGPF